ncbi:ribulokinase [Gramella sp. GC03-9]|uniref:Ribulokinase n=1 Tax=Christiangramia oceanisediminis TaxID=2920386 RepID=A0A9X2I3F4_9FLAO|nr:ribulokinase [Gramella oceanisediminis]MCP9199120.1 ribulokinase [Gramella oceanisediminis]
MNKYVIGLDYGTDSVRAVLVNAETGKESASAVHWYQRWKQNLFCDPARNRFRQHPLDHIEGLENTIKAVLQKTGIDGSDVKGICIDTTGSSPVPVTKEGKALALEPGFEENPNAMMVLWKDHTSINEANEINELARSWGGEDYTKYEGGIYSSEWFWAKILHIAREDEEVKNAAWSWMEHCDLMTYILIGGNDLESFKRSRCAAGHKAMWHKSWGGLPSEDFLEKLHPYLAQLRDKLYDKTYTSDEVAGNLSEEWATKLGLSTDCVIAVGTFDAHAGAIGAQIDENALVRVMGTSTCDIMVSKYDEIGDNTVKGICGQVDGSVVPGMIGLEAGQSAFGDVLAWFRDVLSWPLDNLVYNSEVLSEDQKARLKEEIGKDFIPKLSAQAEELEFSESIPIALDWINGRRTPDANQELKSAFTNLSLGSKAPHIFKALINSICFGSKMIVERFQEEGVKIDTVIGIGGVARKSAYIMQTLANTLNMPIKVASSDEAPALGAAIYASVAAGLYPNVIEASKKLGSRFEAEYHPQPEKVEEIKEHMQEYKELAAFVENSISNKMKKNERV